MLDKKAQNGETPAFWQGHYQPSNTPILPFRALEFIGASYRLLRKDNSLLSTAFIEQWFEYDIWLEYDTDTFWPLHYMIGTVSLLIAWYLTEFSVLTTIPSNSQQFAEKTTRRPTPQIGRRLWALWGWMLSLRLPVATLGRSYCVPLRELLQSWFALLVHRFNGDALDWFEGKNRSIFGKQSCVQILRGVPLKFPLHQVL